MPTKCCWVVHGRLTSERKASPSRSSFINHSTLLLEGSSAKLPGLYMHSRTRQAQNASTRRVDAPSRYIICMITRDFSVISMTSQASLSLSLLLLLLTKVTDAQYRKRFRASYNKSRKKTLKNRKAVLHFRCPIGSVYHRQTITGVRGNVEKKEANIGNVERK